MNKSLSSLSLTCANYGNGQIFRDVLEDWFVFLGGRPAEVFVVDGGSDFETQSTYWRLFAEGKIDKLQLVCQNHRDNDKNKCVIQEYCAGAHTSYPYILFFKVDTLPFRSGHERWLEDAIDCLDREEVFAVGGSFNFDSRHSEAWPGWYYSRKCSLNFALMKREKFMDALDEFARDYIRSGFTKDNPLEGRPDARFVMERALESYMENHNQFTVAREEDEHWTIAHTNLKGKELARARERFLRREGVGRYIDGQKAACEPHGVYYGVKTPSLIKRAKIAFGKSAAGAIWRRIKSSLLQRASCP